MSAYPQTIQLDDIASIIAEKFKDQTAITCYVGSNAATPTAAIEALTRALKSRSPVLPFLKMVHLLLQKSGIVTNRKKSANMGYSTTSLIMGSRELYDYVHMRSGVQMRPSSYTNAAKTIQANCPFVSVNTAIGVDLFGNVWADFIDPRRYYGGVGGQPDFIRAIQEPGVGTPVIAIKSLTSKGESKIVPTSPPGVSLTASAYDGFVLVTEYGIADLRGLTLGNKALAIANVAHPKFREQFLRKIYDDPLVTKPFDFSPDKTPYGVTPYRGDVLLNDD